MQAKTIKKFINHKILSICGAIHLLIAFSACSSIKLGPRTQPSSQEATFFAMGTRWTLSVSGMSSEISFVELKDKVISLAMLYDMTFSDWSSESELRKIELKGWGGESHKVSELMMEGLLLSQEAYQHTKGAFDITTGAISWKVSKFAVGQNLMILNPAALSVRFAKDPKRISFGGLAKGMSLGEMGSLLVNYKVQSFWIDAGGGNRLSYENQKIKFDSYSRALKAGESKEKHIFSPKGESLKKETSHVICMSPTTRRSDLIRWGALSDAYSTAQLVSNDWVLPSECSNE